MHHRCHGVARTFHPSLQRLRNLVGPQQWALPITFFNAGTINEMQIGYAEFSNCAKNPAQHFWSRQRQHNVEAVTLGWGLIQLNMQPNCVGIDVFDSSFPQVPSKQANTNGVANRSFQNLTDVLKTSISDQHGVVIQPEIIPMQMNDVHGSMMVIAQ